MDEVRAPDHVRIMYNTDTDLKSYSALEHGINDASPQS